ncbi:uncharacterized protein TNCT_201301 [Trichonephila clavata]|uniref:Uncharacterized protein n=1 Tax=Trichonephila clavata TaxID=2740835 RepID=A0A8X6H3K8_TRICU|nr:uncharacterized protein TNCT_201301 [Trichonephila clavata]
MHSNNGSGKRQFDNTAPGGGRVDITKLDQKKLENFGERFKREDEERKRRDESNKSLRNKDHIVISFDKSMDADQCMKYLDNMKGRIVETFCGNESTASLSFDMKSFPFNFNRSRLVNSNGKYRFSVPINQSIVFNLKCLLANGLARDITGAMGRNFGLEHVEEYTSDESFDRKSYLYCMRFYDKRLQEYFIESFSATVKGYKNSPKRTDDFLKVKDNCVYIKKSLFDKTKFINEIEESQACLIGRDLQTSSSDDPAIEKIKYLITGFIRKACPPLYYVFHTSYAGNNEDSILVPIVSYDNYYRFLTKEEVDTINSSFGMVVLNNIESYTSPKHLPVFGSRGIYGIDFSNKEISHCVITKIIKNSVINKDHELAIDPERALSPAQSPFNSPTHAGPSGLETPPNPKKGNRDSGLGDSPPRPEDSVAHSSSSDPRSFFEEIQEPQSCFPRQGALLYHNVGAAEVVAAENVQAGTSAWSQLMNPYLSQGTSGNKWQPLLQFPGPGFSDSSGKGAVQNVQAGSSASSRWSSQSTSSGFSDSLWTQSGSSSNKRPDSTHSADSGYSGSLERPQPNSSITTSAVPGISESGKGSNVAAVPVDNKRPQSLPLTENTPKPSSESPKKIIQQFLRNFSIRRSKTNGKATKDILQFDKEKFSSFSSGMQKVLSLPLSLDMIRNLFPHFPIEKWEKLILLARSEKVKKSHSSPKKIEQLLSSLLPEEQEICSLLFFPDRKNETYVDLSPGTREQMVLFWELLRGQEFTEESGIFSGSSSQGSVSSELKHPQQVKHMSEALGK